MIRRLFTLFALGLIAAAFVVAAPGARAGIQDFSVVNQGGTAIWYIQVSPNYADSWEEDVLGDDVLMPGSQLDITMNGYGDHCWFDIRIEDANGYADTWYDVNLCEVGVVYFPDASGGQATTASGNIQDFVVVNNGKTAIWYIQVSPNYSDSWEEDVLGDDVLMPGNQLAITMNGYGDHCWFDIRIEDANANYSEYFDVNLCEVTYVDFP